MAYRKTPNIKAHLKAQREAIVAGAASAVAKHGRERILAHTIERARVSMGTIYQHFADVDELWNAVVAAALARDVSAMRRAAESGPAYPLNALARAIAVFYTGMDEPRLARALADAPAYRKGIRTALEPLIAAVGFAPRARRDHAAAILGALYGLADVEASPKTAIEFALRAMGIPEAGVRPVAHAASREVTA